MHVIIMLVGLARGRPTLFRLFFGVCVPRIIVFLRLCLCILILLIFFVFLIHQLYVLLLLLILKSGLLFAFLTLKQNVTDLFCKVKVDGIVFNESLDRISAVVYLRELDEERNQVEQLTVLWIIIPRDNGHGLLWLEHVGRRRVVKNHAVFGSPAQLGHVLGEHTVDIGAVLSEQPHGTVSVCIHLVHQGLSVLGKTCSENDQFVVLSHDLEEVFNSWPLLYEDIADGAFDVDRDDKVRVLDLIELTVHQSFIQIQHQGLHTFTPFRRRSQHTVSLFLVPVVPIPHHVTALGLRTEFGRLVCMHLRNLSDLALRNLGHH